MIETLFYDFDWWIPVGALVVLLTFRLAKNRFTVMQGEVWERFSEDAVDLAIYAESFVLATLLFFESGDLILRILFKDTEVVGHIKVLQWSVIPFIVLLTLLIAILLKIVAEFGFVIGKEVAEEEIERRAERREEREAKVRQKLRLQEAQEKKAAEEPPVAH